MNKVVSIGIMLLMFLSIDIFAKDISLSREKIYLRETKYHDDLSLKGRVIELEDVEVEGRLVVTCHENGIINLKNVECDEIYIVNTRGKNIVLDNINTNKVYINSEYSNVVTIKDSEIKDLSINSNSKILLCENNEIGKIDIEEEFIAYNKPKYIDIQVNTLKSESLKEMNIDVGEINVMKKCELKVNSKELIEKIVIQEDLKEEVIIIDKSSNEENIEDDEENKEQNNSEDYRDINLQSINIINFYTVELVFDGIVSENINKNDFIIINNYQKRDIDKVYIEGNKVLIELYYDMYFERSIYRPSISKPIREEGYLVIEYNYSRGNGNINNFKKIKNNIDLRTIREGNISFKGEDYTVDSKLNIIELGVNKFMWELIEEIDHEGNIDILYSVPDKHGLITEDALLTIIAEDGSYSSYEFKINYVDK